MPTIDRETATRLLSSAAAGREDDAARLVEALYDELRRMAGGLLGGERVTLQPTELVNEAYIRLIGLEPIDPACRGRFFALASRVMRSIIVDHARARGRLKRGGGWDRVAMEAAEREGRGRGDAGLGLDQLIALDEALSHLERIDERKARLVELRFFGGLPAEQAAELLGIARSTAADDWRVARAWLLRELSAETDGAP